MSGEGLRDFLMQVIALIILALPLFLLPAMLKFSGGLLGRIYDKSRGLMYNNMGGKQAENAGTKLRGATGDASKRQFRKRAIALGEAADKKGYDRDEHGRVMGKRKGLAARLGRGVSAATLYPTKRKEAIESQEQQNKRVQEERINSLLSERGMDGQPTARADRLANQSAGAAGAEGAERIRQLANERMLKDYNDEVGRRNKSLGLDHFFIHETEVNEVDDAGNIVKNKDGSAKKLAMHERLAALSGGKTVTWEGQHGKVTVSGKDDYWKEAAMLQIGNTGDSKAVSATVAGDKYEYQKEADGSFKVDQYGQRIVEVDANGQPVASKSNPYLLDDKDRRTLTKYLQGNSSVRSAFPDLIKSEGGAFNNPNANNMKSYHVDEARRNYDFAARNAASGNDRPMTVLRDEFQKAMISENWDSMPVDTREMFESLLKMNAKQIRMDAGLAVPGIPGGSQGSQETQQVIIPSPTVTRSQTQAQTQPAQSPVQQQRQAGGNFGGFNQPSSPAPTPPPIPAAQQGNPNVSTTGYQSPGSASDNYPDGMNR